MSDTTNTAQFIEDCRRMAPDELCHAFAERMSRLERELSEYRLSAQRMALALHSIRDELERTKHSAGINADGACVPTGPRETCSPIRGPSVLGEGSEPTTRSPAADAVGARLLYPIGVDFLNDRWIDRVDIATKDAKQ
jgi:hypothetical protein